MRQAPPRVQVRRVLLLARMLTAMTATFMTVLYAVIEILERSLRTDLPLDQFYFRWWLWLGVFTFWALVMTGARRCLRLHL